VSPSQLHCAADYIDFGAISTLSQEEYCLSFWELSYLARAAGSIVLGYVRPNCPGAEGGKDFAEQRVVLNPPDKEALIRCPEASEESHSIAYMILCL
jgi:hypothetical protein